MERTYIGQRAHSAIHRTPSFNTYYSCLFSQSGNLKPSSFRSSAVGWGVGGGLCYFQCSQKFTISQRAHFPCQSTDKTHMHTRVKKQPANAFQTPSHLNQQQHTSSSLNNFFRVLCLDKDTVQLKRYVLSFPTEITHLFKRCKHFFISRYFLNTLLSEHGVKY